MVESIDFARGSVRGWIEVRDGRSPHLQLREGEICRPSSVIQGALRSDVSSVRGVVAANFSLSAGRSLSPYDVQAGVTAVHAMWGFDDRPLPLVAGLRSTIAGLVDAMPPDVTQPRGNFAHVTAPAGTRLTSKVAEMSSFEIPVGTTSGDGVAIVGRAGHLFLRGGGNSLEAQYTWGTPDGPSGSARWIEERAEGWARVLHQRAQILGSLGVPFRQLVLPEKNSVLPDLMPLKVETPTPLCRHLLREIAREPWFLNSFAMFDEWDEAAAPSWLKVDSHFTAHGALAVTRAVLTDLGLADDSLFQDMRIGPHFEHLQGDLGWRLVGFDMYDRLELPDESTLTSIGPVVEPVSVAEPVGGGHIGTRMEWENDLAPIDAHVLVFGNSYFGRGQKPNQMSWWFSRLVKHLTVIWHPDVDAQVVEQVLPDAVVAQTVERFLLVVPSA